METVYLNAKHLLSCLLFFCMSITLYSQKKVEYRKGYYYSIEGSKEEGYLYYKPHRNRAILFATDANSQPKKIAASRMAGFVIENDSFAIVSNFTVEGVYRDRIRVRQKNIARVLEVGQVILYRCDYVEVVGYSPYGNRDYQQETFIPVFILRRKGTSNLESVPESQQEFNTAMALYFREDKQLAREVSEGKYSNRTIQMLVQLFNSRRP